MKTHLVLSLALLTLIARAGFSAVDWVPSYHDKPVSPEHLQDLEKALPDQAAYPSKPGQRILVFSATQGFRHKSIPLGKVALERLGEKTGAYTTVVSDDPANFEMDTLQNFDAVVLLSPTQDFFMPSKKKKGDFSDEEWQWLKDRHERLVDNLITFVRNGGGLMGIHAATDSCYDHKAYGETIGGYFAGHPWNAKTNVTIRVKDPEHPAIKPVFCGIDDFQLVEEIYKYREEPDPYENNRILLALDVDRSDPVKGIPDDLKEVPVAWVQKVGDGRVFYTSLGHNHHIYTNPLILRHFLTGIQFAAGDFDGETAPQR